MNIILSKLCFFGILLIYLSQVKSDEEAFKREIKIDVYRNCVNNNIFGIYAKAKSHDDVLHYLYSGGTFTDNLSIIIIRSIDLNSSLSINFTECSNLYSNATVNFDGSIDGAFALIFTKLYEYNDTDDNANMTGDKWKIREFSQFNWTVSLIGNKSISFKATSMRTLADKDNIFSKGYIELKFNLSATREYGNMPRLLYTGNNTQIDVILNNLTTNFAQSRFAVEVALVNKLDHQAMTIETIRSTDDEMSPGVFQIKNLYGQNASEDWRQSTYLQWKPVCYLSSSDMSLNFLSITKNYKPIRTENSNYPQFLGSNIFLAGSSMSLLNVTFGMSGDKFYNKSQYLQWTLGYGQGSAPTDSLSIVIIMVIAFGLGLPFIILVVSTSYMVIRKRLRSRIHYESLS